MTRLFATILWLVTFCVSSVAAHQPPLTADTLNLAAPGQAIERFKRTDPLVVKAQVLLDRARLSSGVIDGKTGENLEKAIRAFAAARGLPAEGSLTGKIWSKLITASPEPVLVEYQITPGDLKGPFQVALSTAVCKQLGT